MLLGEREAAFHTEVRIVFQRLLDLVGVTFQAFRLGIEDGHTHPAADIDTDCIRDDRIVNGQHATDRQSVTGMCVGHQGASEGYRQTHCQLHLLFGQGVDEFPAISFISFRLVRQKIGGELLLFNRRSEVFRQLLPDVVILIFSRILQQVAQQGEYRFFAVMFAMFADNVHSLATGYIVGISYLT